MPQRMTARRQPMQGQPGGDPNAALTAFAAQNPGLSMDFLRRAQQQNQPPPTAQGRGVVSQGGAQGVVGRGGNFQRLGEAALRKLGAGGTGTPGGLTSISGGGLRADNPGMVNVMGAAPGSGSIDAAIGNLRGQLGIPMTKPNFPAGMSTQDLSTPSGPGPVMTAAQNPMTKPNFGAAGTPTPPSIPGVAGPVGPTPAPSPAGGSNPYLELLKRRFAGDTTGLGGAGGPQYAY